MSDFEEALRARLTRNAELDAEREQAEAEMDRLLRERAAELQRRERELEAARQGRFEELGSHLMDVARQLKAAQPEAFIVRTGWTESRKEFIAKISTRLLQPARALFVELDVEDDQVLARWTSDLGNAVELWRLLAVDRGVLTDLVLQVADQEQWRGNRPPPFPPGVQAPSV